MLGQSKVCGTHCSPKQCYIEMTLLFGGIKHKLIPDRHGDSVTENTSVNVKYAGKAFCSTGRNTNFIGSMVQPIK